MHALLKRGARYSLGRLVIRARGNKGRAMSSYVKRRRTDGGQCGTEGSRLKNHLTSNLKRLDERTSVCWSPSLE